MKVTWAVMSSVLIWAVSAQAVKLAELNGADQYVAATVNNQGLSGGAVPWSMTSPRSPASGYTGPLFYGGCSNTAGGWAQWRVSNGDAPSMDYINTQDASSAAGDKGWTVVMLTGLTHSVTGYTVNITHYKSTCVSSYRFVARDASSGNFYISGVANEFTGSSYHIANVNLAGAAWYNYNPDASLAGIGSAASWEPLNVSAFGLYVEVTAAGTDGLGNSIRHFAVYGDVTGTQYTLTVNANPGGSATGGGTFGEGSIRTITAVPSNDFVFVNWTGDVYSVRAVTNVLMDSDKTVWANFGPAVPRATTVIVQ